MKKKHRKEDQYNQEDKHDNEGKYNKEGKRDKEDKYNEEGKYDKEDKYKNKNDVIIEETTGTLTAKADSEAVAEAIVDISGNTEGIAIAVAESSTLSASSLKLVGLDNQDIIDTGVGKDTVTGTASGEASVSAMATATATAIAISADTSSATAISSATAVAEAVADLTVVGIENLGIINTGKGNDTITGEATASSVTEIFTETISLALASTENGEATAIADAVALATAEATSTTIGIKDGEFYLGRGDDTINAVATGGETNIGVQNVLIFGGKGDDTFNLQNGTGDIYGGKGDDLLILEGLYIDYTFDESGIVYGVRITNEGNNTNLTVREVENFQFTEDPETNIVYVYYDEKAGDDGPHEETGDDNQNKENGNTYGGGNRKKTPARKDDSAEDEFDNAEPIYDDKWDDFIENIFDNVELLYDDSIDPIIDVAENFQPPEDICPMLMQINATLQ